MYACNVLLLCSDYSEVTYSCRYSYMCCAACSCMYSYILSASERGVGACHQAYFDTLGAQMQCLLNLCRQQSVRFLLDDSFYI